MLIQLFCSNLNCLVARKYRKICVTLSFCVNKFHVILWMKHKQRKERGCCLAYAHQVHYTPSDAVGRVVWLKYNKKRKILSVYKEFYQASCLNKIKNILITTLE